jgi:flagellar basal-body rod protein FlgB
LRSQRIALRALEKLADFHNQPMPEVRKGPLAPCNQRCEAPMLDKMTNRLDFQGKALVLRAERQRIIASNIANADTPGYVGRDMKFGEALRAATGTEPKTMASTGDTAAGANAQHFRMSSTLPGSQNGKLGYTVQTQPSLDQNTVDMDRERANFVDNAVRYEATLRFFDGQAKTMLSAITGQ